MRIAQPHNAEAHACPPFDRQYIEITGDIFGIATPLTRLWRRFRTLIGRARLLGGAASVSSSNQGPSRQHAMGNIHEFEGDLHQAHRLVVVGQMASGIAHDFNNSLQATMLALSLIEKRLNQHCLDDCQDLVRDAHASLRRASALSLCLLNVASPAQNRAKRIDVNEIVGRLQSLVRSALGHSIALSLCLDEKALHVVCDDQSLENAVLNLVINARDAMSAGGRLTISTYRADLLARRAGLAPGPYVGLEVVDTGCGMEPEVLKLAFKAFFTTKPAGQGTGLGLAMVKSFVDGHRGHVEVASSPGCGTTVRIYLPASK